MEKDESSDIPDIDITKLVSNCFFALTILNCISLVMCVVHLELHITNN